MHKSRAAVALLSTGLLVLAMVTPAAAAIGDATGEVTWMSSSPATANRVSEFTVTDGWRVPDSKPRNSSTGDGGVYELKILDPITLDPTTPLHSLTIGDVECVRVGSDWAEFAGVVTEATGGLYVIGEVFLVSVKDGGPGFVDDEIGMKSHGTLSQDPNALNKGCRAALDDRQFGRQGDISGGDITVGIS